MNRHTEKRQADEPIPKEPRSGNQGSAGDENDPLDHTKEGWLSLFRERHPQLSSDCIVHNLIVFQNHEYEPLIITESRNQPDITLLFSTPDRGQLCECGGPPIGNSRISRRISLSAGTLDAPNS